MTLADTPGYLSNAELANNVQGMVDEVKTFKDEQTDVFLSSSNTATITGADGNPVQVPTLKSLAASTMAAAAIYPDAATGVASVADGAYFQVPSSDKVYLTLFRRAGAGATQVNTYASASGIADMVSGFKGATDALSIATNQVLGKQTDPALFDLAGANTRVIGTPAAQASTLTKFQIYVGAVGTLKIKVFSVAGGVYTVVQSVSINIASTGLKVLTTADFGAVPVATGQCVGVYAPTNMLTYQNLAGFNVVSITGDVASGAGTTDATRTWQMQASLTYAKQVATAAAVQDLQNGKGAVVPTTAAALTAVTGATRAKVTDLPAGETIVDLAGGAWRDPLGYVISSALGKCAVAGIEHYFAARDVESKLGVMTRWPSQSGSIVLTDRGVKPAIDRKGVLTTGGRTPFLMASGSGTPTQGSAGFELVSQTSLPTPANAPVASGGFTCTGLTRDSFGLWILANHGQNDANKPNAPFASSIVVLTPDRSRIVQEITLAPIYPGIQSVQGIAWDSSDDTIWFVDVAGKMVRHITRAGVKLNDQISLAALTLPNGCAYVPSQDAIWVSNSGFQTVYLFSCANGAQLATSLIQASADQLWWDDVNRYLYASYGANGSNDNVEVRDVLNKTQVAIYSGLIGTQSIEGIWIDAARTRMVVNNDGGFHTEAKPPLCMVCEYKVTAPPPAKYSDVLTLGLAIRQTATPGSSQAIVASGDPNDAGVYGWGLYLSGANALRLIVRMADDAAAAQVDWTVPGLNGATTTRLAIQVDRVAGTATMVANGQAIAGVVTGSLTGITKSFNLGGRLSIASANGGRSLTSAELSSVAIGGVVVVADLTGYLSQETAGLI